MMPAKTKEIVKTIMPILYAGLFVGLACLASVKGQTELFYAFLVFGIIVGLVYPAMVICNKIDERFDNVEKLLKDLLQKKNEKSN